jgi:hypothetical protein
MAGTRGAKRRQVVSAHEGSLFFQFVYRALPDCFAVHGIDDGHGCS